MENKPRSSKRKAMVSELVPVVEKLPTKPAPKRTKAVAPPEEESKGEVNREPTPAPAKKGRSTKKKEVPVETSSNGTAEEPTVSSAPESDVSELVPVVEKLSTKKPAAKRTKAAAPPVKESNVGVGNGEPTAAPAKKGRSSKKKEVPVEAPSNGTADEPTVLSAPESDVSELVPVVEKLPTKQAAKRTKAAATPVEDGGVGNGEPSSVPAKKGRSTKKKEMPVDAPSNGTAEEPTGKGKKGAAKKPPKPVEEHAPKPTARGRKKEAVDLEKVVEDAAKPTKTNAGDKKTEAEDLEMVAEDAAKPTKRTARGKKKEAEDLEKVAEDAVQPTKRNARGKKKEAEDAVSADSKDQEDEGTSKTKKKGSTKDATNGDIPTVTQRKRTKPVPPSDAGEEEEEEEVAPSKGKKAKATAAEPKINKSATNYESLNFALEADKPWNFKITSWNVAGLRSWIGKGGLEFLEHEKPDILCVQETKCTEDQLPDAARHIPGYHPYWLCKPGGHAGVAIYSRKMPIHVTYGLGDEEQDQDGRLLTAEYEKFYLVCAYVPNAGRKLVTLPKRMRWDEKFHQYLRDLDAKKPVILCGDMNVAHNEIDLANPKTNKKNAGFTQEERDGMTHLLSLGFVDTFRKLYPDRVGAYTFWTYMAGARAKNVGWRLDYFITSERLVSKVTDNVIRSQVFGSDHCPLTLFLNI